MRDLQASLTALAERGIPIGSSQLREQVILELAGAATQRSVDRGRPRRRIRGWRVAIAAFIAVLVGVGGVAMLGRTIVKEPPPATDVVTTVTTPPTTAPETTPSTTLESAITEEPDPMAAPALAWTRVENAALGGDGGQSMNAIASNGARFVAVGSESSEAGEHAAVWISIDGIDWNRILHDEAVFGAPRGGVVMSDVTAGGPGFVAVGSIWNWPGTQTSQPIVEAAAWTSADGEVWTRIADIGLQSDAALVSMNSVTSGGPGLIAVGWDFDYETYEGNAVVWTSVDGLSWNRVPEQGTEFSRALMSDIAPYNGGYVAVGAGRGHMFVGTRGCTGEEECPAAAWTSPDGIVWTRAESDAFAGDWGQMNFVATSGTHIVAGGVQGEAAIWTYDPDAKWARVPRSGPLFGGGVIEILAVVIDGDDVVGVGYRANWESINDQETFDEGDAVVWVSPDRGGTWYRAPTDPAFTKYTDPLARMNDIMLVDGGFLVIGSVGDDAAVWIAEWTDQ